MSAALSLQDAVDVVATNAAAACINCLRVNMIVLSLKSDGAF
jgi:hypothetical protein